MFVVYITHACHCLIHIIIRHVQISKIWKCRTEYKYWREREREREREKEREKEREIEEYREREGDRGI